MRICEGNTVEFEGDVFEHEIENKPYEICIVYAVVDCNCLKHEYYFWDEFSLSGLEYEIVTRDIDGNETSREENPEWCRGFIKDFVIDEGRKYFEKGE